jgi:hypothetical protein
MCYIAVLKQHEWWDLPEPRGLVDAALLCSAKSFPDVVVAARRFSHSLGVPWSLNTKQQGSKLHFRAVEHDALLVALHKSTSVDQNSDIM